MTSKVTHDAPFGLASAPVGSEPWAIRWRIDFQAVVRDLESDPMRAKTYVDIGEKWGAWKLLKDQWGHPFATFEAFCEAKRPHGLEYDAKKFRQLLALSVGKAEAHALTTRPEAAPTPGGKREGAGRKPKDAPKENQGAHAHADSSRTRSEAVTARIARDAPEVLERMKAGEFPSVRAAALAAGIVKPADPVKRAASAFAKVPEKSRVDSLWIAVQRLARHEQEVLCDRLVRHLEVSR